MKEIHKNGIIWQAVTEYYDIEDGSQVTKTKATDKKQYIILKTEKHATLKTTTRGIIKYTTTVRKQPQRRLFE